MTDQNYPAPLGFPVPLSPSKIEKELASMWGSEEAGSEKQKLTHFSLGTVIWLGSSRFIPIIRDIFSKIINDFPCRIILLECTPDIKQENIESYINANCYLDQGSRGKVCSEEIHIRFNENQLQHIKGLVLPLLVPDVSTFFWFFSSTPVRYQSIVPELSRVADITIDEIAFRERPFEGLREMAIEKSTAICLSWFRTVALREQISSFFDDSRNLPLLKDIQRIKFEWYGSQTRKHALVNACMIIGWMADKLGWKYIDYNKYEDSDGNEISVGIKEHEGSELKDCAELAETRIITRGDDQFSLRLASCSGHMNRSIEYKSMPYQDQITTIKLHMLTEAEALVQLLQVPHNRTEFVKAAGCSWELLAYLQSTFDT